MAAMQWISLGILVLAMGGIGGMKLTGNKDGIEQAERLGYDKIRIPIGIAEVLAAIAVVLGVVVESLEWLGMAAGYGIIAMMIGAFGLHMRARDKGPAIPSVVVGVAAIVYLVALNGS